MGPVLVAYQEASFPIAQQPVLRRVERVCGPSGRPCFLGRVLVERLLEIPVVSHEGCCAMPVNACYPLVLVLAQQEGMGD